MVIGSLADLIRSHARRRPDAPALTAGAERLTFADLDRRSNQVGAALVAAGVAPGDRVAYLGKNTLAFFELLFGASKAGAVTVPVNWRLAPAEIADILDDSAAAVLVVGPEFAATVEPMVARLPAMRHVLTLDRAALPGGETFERWSDVAAPDDPGHQPGRRRRRPAAVHVGDDRPAQGGDAHQPQRVEHAAGDVAGLGVRRDQRQPRGAAQLPRRWCRLGARRSLRRRVVGGAARVRRRRGARPRSPSTTSRTSCSCPPCCPPCWRRWATRGSTSARWRRSCTAPRRSPRACSPRRCARSRAASSRGTG